MAYQINIKKLNHNLYLNIMNQNYAEAQKLLDIGFSGIDFKFKDRRGFISLAINFHISQNNDREIDLLLNTNLDIIMKRDFLKCIKYYYDKDNIKSHELFNMLLENFYFDNQCLDFILDNNMYIFLIQLDGKFLKTSNDYNIVQDYTCLKKVPFDTNLVFNSLIMIDALIKSEIMNSLKVDIKNESIDISKLVVIDAGNILFSTSGKVTKTGYNNLVDTVEYILTSDMIPIVVIHTRHLKKNFKSKPKSNDIIKIIEYLRSNNNIFIIETPYNINDDFYIIYIALYYQCQVITNDNYKDHIYNFRSNKNENEENMIENYIDSLLIKYNVLQKKIIIEPFYNYSKCIQVVDNIVYIPNNKNFTKIFID